jgi:lysophospholipase L1-like esterase
MPENTQLLEDLGFDYAYLARQVTKWRKDHKKTAPPTESLTNAITSVRYTDAYIGSSVLEVIFCDPGGEFLDFFDVDENGRLDAIDINYPPDNEDAWWRMTQMDISQQTGMPVEFTLKFLERPAVYLMGRKGPEKKSRATTRAQFLQMLVGKVKGGGGLLFFSAELTKNQVSATTRPVSTPGGGGKQMVYGGDSLGVGTGPLMKKFTNYDDTIVVAAKSRTSAQVQAALTPRLTNDVSQVVFDAGSSDGTATGYAARLASLYAAIDNRDLILVTVHGVAFAAAMNSAITTFANANARVSVADWDALAGDHPEWLTKDGIHPNTRGYAQRAQLVKNALPAPPTLFAALRAADPPPNAPINRPFQPVDPSYPGDQPGYGYEVTAKPPTTKKNTAGAQKTRQSHKTQGIRSDAKLTITDAQGHSSKVNTTQIRLANICLDVAMEQNAGQLAMEAMMCAAIAESGISEIMNKGGSGYGGVFQGDVDVTYHYFKVDDTKEEAYYFLMGGKGFQGGGAKSISKRRPNLTPGEIALMVEASKELPHFYQRHVAEARAFISAYGGAPDHGTVTTRAQYNFEIGKGENYWDGMNRLAQEVNWRLFVDGRTVFYDADTSLIRQIPAGRIKRTDPAVVSWDATWDGRRIATEMSMELICDPFEFRAGEVLELEDFGILSAGSTVGLPGRWLITEVERSSGQVFSSFKLAQPEHPKPEPATQSITRSEDDNDDPTEVSKGSALRIVDSSYSAENVINRIVLPIVRKMNKDMANGVTEFTIGGGPITVENLRAVNARHGPTGGGSTSDHQGNGITAWAADISNATHPSPEMDRLAKTLILAFDLPDLGNWNATSGAPAGNLISYDKHKDFRYQLIYRYNDAQARDHFNHVHFGVHRKAGSVRTSPSSSSSSGGSSGTGRGWNPAATKVEMEDAGSFVSGAGRKIVHHTTEGSSIGGAEGAYRANHSSPHFTLDHDTGALHQHIPVTRAARSLKHTSGTPETNRAYAIQIEHVGFAAQTGSWSAAAYDRIATLCRWIEANAGVPRSSSVSYSNPSRMSGDAFFGYAGHCGHVHVPGNDHVDPGTGFKISSVI